MLRSGGKLAGGMQNNSLPDGGVDGRQAVRVNLFMAATLHTAGVAHPVKIRDLSAVGAKIESSLLPEVGSEMTLSRGPLSVSGHVAWCTERRCGLRFSAPVSVQAWMANPVNREQSRVDHVVAAVKAGVVPIAPRDRRKGATFPGVAGDLGRVSRLLEILGDALAGDPEIITRHGTTLQNLDIATQTLTALAEAMQSGAPADGPGIDRLDELRISCAEALKGAA
jgi:hypothetical protein